MRTVGAPSGEQGAQRTVQRLPQKRVSCQKSKSFLQCDDDDDARELPSLRRRGTRAAGAGSPQRAKSPSSSRESQQLSGGGGGGARSRVTATPSTKRVTCTSSVAACSRWAATSGCAWAQKLSRAPRSALRARGRRVRGPRLPLARAAVRARREARQAHIALEPLRLAQAQVVLRVALQQLALPVADRRAAHERARLGRRAADQHARRDKLRELRAQDLRVKRARPRNQTQVSAGNHFHIVVFFFFHMVFDREHV